MTREQVSDLVDAMQREREEARRIRNIVSCLMMVLNIPEGNHLVCLFGKGDEKDNREALTAWVKSMRPEFDMEEAELRLQDLCKKARRRLECAQEWW